MPKKLSLDIRVHKTTALSKRWRGGDLQRGRRPIFETSRCPWWSKGERTQCAMFEFSAICMRLTSHFDQFIIIHPVLHTCGKTMKKHTLLLISAQNLVSWFSALTIGASRENEPLWVQEVLYGIKKEGKVWRFSSSTFIMNGCQRRQKKVQNQHQAISVFRGGGCNEKRSIKWRHFMHRHSNMSHCVLFFLFWCLYVTTKLIF